MNIPIHNPQSSWLSAGLATCSAAPVIDSGSPVSGGVTGDPDFPEHPKIKNIKIIIPVRVKSLCV
ncbi:hypothetical protein KAU08_11175, partial [bacterium]|nr:hypothetical protein [bacterium]